MGSLCQKARKMSRISWKMLIVPLAFCIFEFVSSSGEVKIEEDALKNGTETYLTLSDDVRLICNNDSQCPRNYSEGGKKFVFGCQDNFCIETVYKDGPILSNRSRIGKGKDVIFNGGRGGAGGWKPSSTSSVTGVSTTQIVSPNSWGRCRRGFCKKRRKCCKLVPKYFGPRIYWICPSRC